MTTLERISVPLLELKMAGEHPGAFSGYGAVFGNADAHGDVIRKGAFAETLKHWQEKKGKWPKMLLQHGGFSGAAIDMVPVGQYTDMEENSKGLKVAGRLFAMNTERGQYIYESMKSGELDSLSIGFQTKEAIYGTKPSEPARTLTNIDLWEVSLVTFPANDQANILTVKSLSAEQKRDLEEALRDEGLSHKDSRTAVSFFHQLLQRDAGAPSHTPRDEAVSDEERAVLEAMHKLLDKTCAMALGR